MLISIQIKNGSTLRADICGENCGISDLIRATAHAREMVK